MVEHERQAAVILDGMYQFVALLNPKGDILEVNRAALEGAGHRIEEIRGKPFWTARWWQISEQVRRDLQTAIRRAATGEFVRYEVDIYGEQSGLVPITIDFSLQPIRGESGEVEYLLPEGRNITERKRAEEQVVRQAQELRVLNERLKELDRLKTQFFANVSHEFRTPLTLMLGPLEDALANAHGILPLGATENLQVSHRNALRLLKLVNTMLDFSRIEAGRVQASYQPVDLAALTSELASNFRSACEKAGLRLIVDCPPLNGGELAYVDRDMWEKIVLNLVSNAFKFTLKGEIEVCLQAVDGRARLMVRDTGVGIASEELPRMFERFHRIEHNRGRTYEGTGIGLALVQELVKLHGGTVGVESTLGEGSVFTVTVPLGKAHLDPDCIGKASNVASTAIASSTFVEEAVRWLPEAEQEAEQTWIPSLATSDRDVPADQPRGQRARILWADDNADMREYVRRLLGDRFDVQAVTDGQVALEAARANPPDLVLSDLMMPRLDGFGLLLALRADPQLREIPIILLSARAGEESRIEGLQASADDYLIKPFSARELIARVETQVKMSRMRQEAKAVLRESEDRFRMFANTAPAILWITESDASCSFVSRGWYDYTGQSEEEALGLGWLNAVHPDDREESRRIFLDANTRHEPFSLDYRLRRADGEYGWTIASGRPRFDTEGNFVGFIGSVIDIHERRQAEQASALLSAIVDSSDDAIISKDLNGVITSWNKSAERLFGYTADEAVGRPITMLIPPDRLDEEPKILEQLKRGERVDHFETIRVRKDGSRLNISLTISPVKGADGRIVGASKIARDITERKRAQEALKNLNANLETLVADRTAELRRSITERERLQDQLLQAQKMESLGTLASGVAHDFNNLLNIILSHATIMRVDDKNPASISEGAAVIEETVRRGASLVQQLLTLGRKSETRFEPVRLNSLAEKLANLLTETFTKTIIIILDLEPGLPAINGDENQLHRTLLNLCVNARDAMPEGGRISLKTETVSGTELRRHVPGAAAERYVSISVTDRGIGMDDATQRRVFEPFFTTKPVGQGTGLGLAVVYGIVKNHDGFIEVKSKLGHGTSFWIYLPIPSEAARQTSAAGSNYTAPKRAGSGETILFVEDEERQLNVMRRFLENEGYRVLSAKNGVEALETFKQHKDAIAVAVLDLGLPQLGGWQAFQQMREIRPELKALIATGLISPEVEAEIAQEKLCGVLSKPYQLDDVLAKISQAIHGYGWGKQ